MLAAAGAVSRVSEDAWLHRSPASYLFANAVIFQRIGEELIKVEVIAAVRSYNRRHASDSEGFDDKADGGPVRVVLRLPGVG